MIKIKTSYRIKTNNRTQLKKLFIFIKLLKVSKVTVSIFTAKIKLIPRAKITIAIKYYHQCPWWNSFKIGLFWFHKFANKKILPPAMNIPEDHIAIGN